MARGPVEATDHVAVDTPGGVERGPEHAGSAQGGLDEILG